MTHTLQLFIALLTRCDAKSIYVDGRNAYGLTRIEAGVNHRIHGYKVYTDV